MGLIPRETQNAINNALKCLYSIDKSLGRIADALEKQNETTEGSKMINEIASRIDPRKKSVTHHTELGPIEEE